LPYIPADDRIRFERGLEQLSLSVDLLGISNGDLNYLITRLAGMYLRQHGRSYNTMSDVVKAMECAKLEFYAVAMRPYEAEKAALNGKVL
jgi:hypothetical protein